MYHFYGKLYHSSDDLSRAGCREVKRESHVLWNFQCIWLPISIRPVRLIRLIRLTGLIFFYSRHAASCRFDEVGCRFALEPPYGSPCGSESTRKPRNLPGVCRWMLRKKKTCPIWTGLVQSLSTPLSTAGTYPPAYQLNVLHGKIFRQSWNLRHGHFPLRRPEIVYLSAVHTFEMGMTAEIGIIP